MMFLLLFAKAIRIAYLALRAAAGIMVLGHGMHVWVQNKRA